MIIPVVKTAANIVNTIIYRIYILEFCVCKGGDSMKE